VSDDSAGASKSELYTLTRFFSRYPSS
jgi:hypothetical protein